MSVTAINAFSTATGNGATTSFPYTFAAKSAAEVAVYVNGTLQTVGFTVTPNAGGNGGTVLFAVAPANAAAIIIATAPSFQQNTTFVGAGAYNPASVDGANDEAAIRDIFLKGLIDRAMLFPLGETAAALPSAANRAGKYLYFDPITGQPTMAAGTTGGSGLTNGTFGDIIVTGAGATMTLGPGAVTLAKMANLAANSILGNNTGGAATPIALTAAQVTAMLPGMVGDSGAGGTKGLVPAAAAGDAAAGKFLKADGTWTAPPGSGAGTTTNALTFSSAGDGDVATSTFNGSAGRKISYNSIGAAPLASPALTGTPTAPTAGGGTNTTQIATTAFVQAALPSLAAYAPLASPALTGNPTAPTPAAGDADTSIATTAFVDALRDVPQNLQTTNYPLALTDRGKGVDFNGTSLTCTIPANGSVAFPIGTVIVLTNLNATSLSIAITTDTLTLSGSTTTGTRTLGQNGEARLRKVAATSWLISGTALT